jgi:hypothetical protein
MEEINEFPVELFDAATALRDAVEKAKPIIDAIEARWGEGCVGAASEERNGMSIRRTISSA